MNGTAKKLISLVLSLAIMFSITTFLRTPAYATNESSISVILDGAAIAFDVRPQIIKNRTMVPMRAIFEALGLAVNWDSSSQSAIASNSNYSIEFKINSTTMYSNGKAINLDSPAVIIDGRTLVPVRAISESINCQVGWDGKRHVVSIISSKGNYTMMYSVDGREYAVDNQKVDKYEGMGWFSNKTDLNVRLSYNSKHTAALNKAGKPSEKDYTDFVCDYYNSNLDINVGWYTYSSQKHSYQFHLGASLKESYQYLSSSDTYTSYRMYSEAYRDIFEDIRSISSNWYGNLEYAYWKDLIIEVVDPIYNEVIFICSSGNVLYSKYFSYAYEEEDIPKSPTISQNADMYRAFVDYIVNNGSYSDNQYGITCDVNTSSLSGPISLIYDPNTSTLRLESYLKDSNQTRFLTLYLTKGGNCYNWQLQWQTSSFIAGNGTLKTGVDINQDSSAVTVTEMIRGSQDYASSLKNAAETEIDIATTYMDMYINDLNNGLDFGYFNIGK